MPPAGVATIMDDDALIELEIAQQLQQLGEENNAINELQDEVNEDDIFNIDEVEVVSLSIDPGIHLFIHRHLIMLM